MKENLQKHDQEEWISISDLSFGLMVVFMFIAISYMLQVQEKNKEIENVAQEYMVLKQKIYEDLHQEFKKDLKRWEAEIDKQNLSIRFNSPDILFDQGRHKVKKEFKVILNSFFPRYVKVLTVKKEYKSQIEEIRIEGHTNSLPFRGLSSVDSYFKNVDLSQKRTRSVLEYIYTRPSKTLNKNKDWLKSHLTANGLASIKPILNKKGKEDFNKSKRVEFRVKLKAESKIDEILKRIEK